MVLMNEEINLLQEVDEFLELGDSGHAKVTEIDTIEEKLRVFLQKTIDTETLFGRKFDKETSGTIWKIKQRGKYADKKYLSTLLILRKFLVEFIEQSDVEVSISQKFIKPGSVYEWY
jgi:hypothetical protein